MYPEVSSSRASQSSAVDIVVAVGVVVEVLAIVVAGVAGVASFGATIVAVAATKEAAMVAVDVDKEDMGDVDVDAVEDEDGASLQVAFEV